MASSDRLSLATASPPQIAAIPDRRQAVRHATILQVARLILDRGEELCILRDISAGGLKATVYCPLAQGDRVTIVLKTGRKVAGRVAWADRDVIGVAFDRRVSVVRLLAHHALEKLGHRVRSPRLNVDLPGELRDDGAAFDVRIRDVSQGGMRLVVDRLLDLSRPYELTVPALGTRTVVVCWCRDAQAGVAFKQPLGYPEFASWRQALAAGSAATTP